MPRSTAQGGRNGCSSSGLPHKTRRAIARARTLYLFVWLQKYHSLSLGYCTPESARSRLRSARSIGSNSVFLARTAPAEQVVVLGFLAEREEPAEGHWRGPWAKDLEPAIVDTAVFEVVILEIVWQAKDPSPSPSLSPSLPRGTLRARSATICVFTCSFCAALRTLSGKSSTKVSFCTTRHCSIISRPMERRYLQVLARRPQR